MNLVTGSFGGTMELTSEERIRACVSRLGFPAQAAMSNDPMHTAVLTAQFKRVLQVPGLELSETLIAL